MSVENRQALAVRLQLKSGDTVNRFKCSYTDMMTDEVGALPVCDLHKEWSYFDFEFGPHRPCNAATIDDKLPLSITQFLYDRAHEITRKVENSVLEDENTKLAEMIYIIVGWHESWPVLVETEPKFETFQPGDGLDQVGMRMTLMFDWISTNEFKKRFGKEAPTAPLLRQLASMWDDHVDFQQEWVVG